MANIGRRPPAPEVKEITVDGLEQAIEKKESCVILDVRTCEEHALNSIKQGEILIPRGVIDIYLDKREQNQLLTDDISMNQQRLNQLYENKSKKIIVICQSGYRSAFITKRLEEHGFTDVVSLKGGVNAWKEAHPTPEMEQKRVLGM